MVLTIPFRVNLVLIVALVCGCGPDTIEVQPTPVEVPPAEITVVVDTSEIAEKIEDHEVVVVIEREDGPTPTPENYKPCVIDEDCEDGNKCTHDVCEGGMCYKMPALPDFSELLGAPNPCDDDNACTEDICNINTGQCEYGNPCSDYHDGCVEDWVDPDVVEFVCYVDDCSEYIGSNCLGPDAIGVCMNGECVAPTLMPTCSVDEDCEDGDLCTYDACWQGVCENTPACMGDAECVVTDELKGGFGCIVNCGLPGFSYGGTCVQEQSGEFGQCLDAVCMPFGAECSNSGHCNDWNDSTEDWCTESGICQYDPIFVEGPLCYPVINYDIVKNDEVVESGVVEIDLGCCQTDDDCTGSSWGSFCVPSKQPGMLGLDHPVTGETFTGLCQMCNQDLQIGCGDGQTCSWGIEDLLDTKAIGDKYGYPFSGAPGRSVNYCTIGG